MVKRTQIFSIYLVEVEEDRKKRGAGGGVIIITETNIIVI